MGKAYNHVIESLVREIASGGRAQSVHHYVLVDRALLEKLASAWIHRVDRRDPSGAAARMTS
ncbi:MAG: hypothetical protein LC777_19675 [Actinobacteria bacterium]|nr:hypothetical protein [Actinomycetota bacterium]